MTQNKQKMIIITGGAQGIGLGIAQKLINLKQRLIIVDKNAQKLEQIKNKNIMIRHLDLSSSHQIEKFIEDLENEKIIIDNLINNVGYQENVDVLNISLVRWRKLFKVNLEAALLFSQFVAKQMIKNKIRGNIINITSVHSQIIRDMPHYSCSKSALEMLTKELAYKLAQYNIRVNAIAPGAINTPLLRKDLNTHQLLSKAARHVPLKRLGTPEDIANVVEFLISDQSNYITGTTIIVDGGLSLVI